MARLWDTGEGLDEVVLRFTTGDDPHWDERLVAYDVRASAAHVRMLAEQGNLPAAEAEALIAALKEIGREHEAGAWKISAEEEDAHTALEVRLVRRLGETGGKVHLARSRNDQVLAALRLYLLDAVEAAAAGARQVAAALRSLARQHEGFPLPGYTHLQRAMPSSVEAWCEGHAAEIEDDAAGLVATRRRLSRNPLGSAAGYGVPVVPIDRERTRELLGFDEVHEPVTAVQLSRGKAESTVLFELTLLTQDLARLSQDVILFATSEFGFLQLPARFTTGSSIMPQKRNPDVFELIRGRASLVQGWLHAALGLFGRLPSGYHRDLQLLKDPLFRGLDATMDVLRIAAHALPEIRFDRARCAAAIDPQMRAAERAYRLVRERGLPFREAYRIVKREGEAPLSSAGARDPDRPEATDER